MKRIVYRRYLRRRGVNDTSLFKIVQKNIKMNNVITHTVILVIHRINILLLLSTQWIKCTDRNVDIFYKSAYHHMEKLICLEIIFVKLHIK